MLRRNETDYASREAIARRGTHTHTHLVLAVPSRPSHQSFCTCKRLETLSTHLVPEDRNTRSPPAIVCARTSHGGLPVITSAAYVQHAMAKFARPKVSLLHYPVWHLAVDCPCRCRPCASNDCSDSARACARLPPSGGQSCRRAWRQGPAADGAAATLCSLLERCQAACLIPSPE